MSSTHTGAHGGAAALRAALTHNLIVTVVDCRLLPGVPTLTHTDSATIYIDTEALDDAELMTAFAAELARYADTTAGVTR